MNKKDFLTIGCAILITGTILGTSRNMPVNVVSAGNDITVSEATVASENNIEVAEEATDIAETIGGEGTEESDVVEEVTEEVEEVPAEFIELNTKYQELDGITPPQFTGEVIAYIGDLAVTDEDVWFMQRMCMSESGGEPYVGKIAVVETAINNARKNGVSIAQTITTSGKYSTANNGEPNAEVLRAVDYAIYGEDLFPSNMTAFKLNGYHSFGTPYTVIGSHYFSCVD